MKYLKAWNSPVVAVYVVWCMALCAVFLAAPADFWRTIPTTFAACRSKDGLLVVLLPIVVLVLTGVISSKAKASLVFWRLRNALPGHQAFSQLVHDDPRIDIQALKAKIGAFPDNPREQNQRWYSLYRQCESAIPVQAAHKRFLLSRDLAGIAFLFGVIGPWGIWLARSSYKWALAYCGLMLAQYLVLAVTARNHGNRFVCNVLVEHAQHGPGVPV